MPLKLIPAGQGFEALTEAVTTEYGALLDLVRQALREKVREKVRGTPGYSEYYCDVQGIWPDRVVCRLNGRLWSYGYTVNADNTIAIGEGAEVVLSFAPVREAAAAAADPNAAFREAADGSIEVTIIRAGTSINGNFYPDSALQEAVQLFEGVRVFSKSDAEHTAGAGKDVRNLLGGIYGVRFVAGASPDTGALVGTFKAIDPADATVTKMTEAVKRGMQGLMGLSIDAIAATTKAKRDGKTVRVAKRFAKVNSVDLIVSPGAGGGLDRLTESTDEPPPHEQPGEDMLKTRLFEALVVLAAAQAAALDVNAATDDQVVSALKEACTKQGLDFGAVVAAATGTDAKAALARLVEAAAKPAAKPGQERLTESEAPVTRAELALHQAKLYALSAIAASTLPAIAKDKLQAQFKGAERFTEADVDAAIKAEREYLARFSESGRPTGGLARIEVGDRTKVVADMLDAFFDPKHKDHDRVQSFKECYIEITGDRYVTGIVDSARLTESVGTDTFADALGNSMTRRMQQAYREAVRWDSWADVVTVAPVNDFRTQERTEIGGFGNLPIVAERGAYVAMTDPSDDKASYAVSKRGGLIEVTMEAIKNDDVGAIRRLPVNGGRAAKRTLYTFVFNFFASNPTIYDSVALYHASHGNLFTTAFSAAQYSAHRLAMMKQTGRDTANRMGIDPRMVLCPVDLQETVADAFVRGTNNDKTFVQTQNPTIVPVITWTDANDWVTLADPMDIPVLEIGFLDGNREPVLLTQDTPTEGKVFTNDIISWKIRHTYGGNILVDGFKGTTKAVVP